MIPVQNPFPGPKPYRAADRSHFFGRDDVAYRLSRLILASRCVTVHGPSGAGKSSLLQASILPGLAESEDARVLYVDGWPDHEDPTRWLAQAMYTGLAFGAPPQDLSPGDAVLAAAKRAARASSRMLVVYLDQLEQLLYVGRSSAETEPFFETLGALVDLPLRSLHVVLSLREDYLGRFRDRLRDRQRILGQAFRVGPLSVAELTEAVCQAAAVGEPSQSWDQEEIRALMLEVRVPGHAATDEAEAQSAYAQIVCRALFQERAEGGVPSKKGIPAEAIVRNYFESTLSDLGPQRPSAERLLEDHLITADGSRTLRTEKELSKVVPAGELGAILQALERAAILQAQEHQGSRYFELGHDWLARRVLELRKAREARDEERRREEERQKALEEERRAAEERLAKARSSRRRVLVLLWTALAFGAFTSVVVVLTYMAKKDAVAAQQRAEAARVEALLQSVEAHDQKALAGFSALSSGGELAWGMKLLNEVRLPALRQGWITYASDALQTNMLRVSLRGHNGALTAAFFSPDARLVLTASTDGSARVWRRDGTGKPIVLAGHQGAIHFATWSPDGQRVLTLSEDATARVYRADGKGEPIVLRGATDALVHGGMSPDGKRVVTASLDGKARVHDIEGASVVVLEGHTGPLTHARFLADGVHIVTASDDGTARVWDTRDASRSVTLSGHKGPVTFVVPTPDGSHVVTTSLDGTARVFPLDGKGEAVVLAGHDGPVLHADVSPDGTRVATASADRAARIFPIDGKGAPILLLGHARAVTYVEFRPDGRALATASADATARLWPADGKGAPIVLKGHAAPLRSASFSFDGTELVTAAADITEHVSDHSAKLWTVPAQSIGPAATGQHAFYHFAHVGAEGRLFAAAGDDSAARLVRIGSGDAPVVFKGHEGWVTSAALSAQGDRVVTASLDGTARVWDAKGQGAPVVLRGPAPVRRAAFSPDGTRVVTASEDGMARVFASDGTGSPVVLGGHQDWLTSASFSPDGSLIVTASMDHTARVLRADGTGAPVVLTGHGAPVVDAVFDPRGERVVTISEDGTARVFRADGAGEPILLGIQGALPIAHAAWSRDGKRVVLSSDDGLLRIWNADGSGRPIWLIASFAPLAVSFVDGDQAVLAVGADGRAHRWMIDVEALRKRIDESNADCIPAWARALTMGESLPRAEWAFQLCESRYGRMPAPARAPVEGGASGEGGEPMQDIDPAVLARASAGPGPGEMVSGPHRELRPALPLLRDAGPTARREKVIVLPSSASVIVGGVAARRRDGVIEIEGKVGDVLRVRVTQAGVALEQEVTLGDGAAAPAIIDLRPRLAARASTLEAAAHRGSAPGFDPMLFAGAESADGVAIGTPLGMVIDQR
jgi:WD40 repeat protein